MCSAPLIYMLDPNLSQMCSDSPFQTGSFSTEHRAVWIPSCGTNKSPSFGPGLVRWRFSGLCGLPAGGLRDGVAVFPVPVGSRRELLLRTWRPPLFLCLRRWELHRQSKALRSGPATAPSSCLKSLPSWSQAHLSHAVVVTLLGDSRSRGFADCLPEAGTPSPLLSLGWTSSPHSILEAARAARSPRGLSLSLPGRTQTPSPMPP